MIKHAKRGFTLVEIMIVVAIIGILAALGFPALNEAGNRTRARRFARDIQTAGHAFLQYAMETGQYPADRTPAQMPDGMAGYLWNFPWTDETAVGGNWDWDYQQFGTEASVSVHMPNWNDDRMQLIDAVMDDGNLSTGTFRKRSGGYMYVLEESE
jgi:prepilin-type N-terminal cleavage/methylation domain-containing protein